MSPIQEITKTITLTAAGGTISLDVVANPTKYYIEGNVTLSSSWTIEHTGTPVKGMLYKFKWTATIVPGVNSVTIFGFVVPDEALANEFIVSAEYDGAAWDVTYVPDFESGADTINGASIIDVTIPTAKHVDKAITLGKMADVNEGYILLGDNSNRPIYKNIAPNATFLLGDGTTANNVSMSGDGTMDNAGVFTLGAAVVTLANMANLAEGYVILGNATNRPTAFDVSASAKIPIGSGTTMVMQSMSGDGTLSAGGVFTLGAGIITSTKIADGQVFSNHTAYKASVQDSFLHGIPITSFISGVNFKSLLDNTLNNFMYLPNVADVLYKVTVFVETVHGAPATIDIGVDATLRVAGADGNGIIAAADAASTGVYASDDATYQGALMTSGYFIVDGTAGFLTIQSSIDISAGAFVGSCTIETLRLNV